MAEQAGTSVNALAGMIRFRRTKAKRLLDGWLCPLIEDIGTLTHFDFEVDGKGSIAAVFEFQQNEAKFSGLAGLFKDAKRAYGIWITPKNTVYLAKGRISDHGSRTIGNTQFAIDQPDWRVASMATFEPSTLTRDKLSQHITNDERIGQQMTSIKITLNGEAPEALSGTTFHRPVVDLFGDLL